MNREDIIRMAEEAGLVNWEATAYANELERFAALVASAEREAWEYRYARLQSLMDVRETQPNKPCCLAEREACAEVCDVIAQKMDDEGEGPTGNIGWVIDCADSIRARGQA